MNLSALIFVYACVLMIGSIFGAYLWRSYGDELLKYSFLIWVAAIIGFISQGFFHDLDFLGFAAYSTNALLIYFVIILSDKMTARRLPVRKLCLMLGLAVIISYCSFLTDLSYTLKTLPFSIACAVCFIFCGFYQKFNSPLAKGYILFLLFAGLHFLDYPFLRPHPELAVIGFTSGLIFLVCHAMIVPLFVMKNIADRFAGTLMETVKVRTRELQTANDNLLSVNETLSVTNESLAVASKDRQMLLNVIIHDLNNPLNAISGVLRTLKKSAEPPPDYHIWLDMGETAVQNIKNTTTHVANFVLAKDKSQSLELEVTDALSLLKAIRDQFADTLALKNIILEIDEHSMSELKVIADAYRLKNQVFANLISNAIKFSPINGRIQVFAKVKDDIASICVRDYGDGIPADKRENLFEQDLNKSTFGTSGERGLGLGLSIVNYYLKLMNGSIGYVEPENGEPAGACFEVSLPVHRGA